MQSGSAWWSFVLACIAMLVVLVAVERPVEARLLRYAIWAVPERYEWTLDWAEGFCLLVLALDIGMRLRFLGGRFLVEQVLTYLLTYLLTTSCSAFSFFYLPHDLLLYSFPLSLLL